MSHLQKFTILFIIISAIIICCTLRAEGRHVSETEIPKQNINVKEYIKVSTYDFRNENIAVDVIYEGISRKSRLEDKESSESTPQE